jgi:uncharacterized membrane protein YbhN (UPF0104 family)
MNRKRSVAWVRLLGMLLSLGFLIWLLARQDWQRLLAALRLMPIWMLGLAFALYLVGQFANAARWLILLRAQEVPVRYGQAVRLVFAGAFASNFLPSTIGGDALRLVGLTRLIANPGMAAASIVLDRFMNVLSYVTVLPVAAWTLTGVAEQDFVLGGVLMGWSSRVGAWLSIRWQELRRALQLWQRKKSALLGAFGVSWFSIFVIFCALWILARGLGMNVAFYQVMGINVLTYLLTLLPITFNGLGVREVTIVTLYVQLGATSEQALALAVISRLMLMAETLPGAFWVSEALSGKSTSSCYNQTI